MGSWATNAKTKAERCAEIVKECVWENESSKSELCGKRVTNTGLWTLQKITNGIVHEVEYILTFHKMGLADGMWWVKSMDVSCIPYYYDCPATLVNQWKEFKNGKYLPSEMEWLSNWEEANAHWDKAMNLKTGDRVKQGQREVIFSHWYNKSRSQYVGMEVSTLKAFRWTTANISEFI